MGFDKNCEEKTNKQTQIVVVIVVHPLETEVNDLFQGKAGEQGVSVLLQVHTQWNKLKIPSKWQDLQKISPESWKVLKGVKILLNGRSIDGRNFTLEKMARSLFGEDICWAFHSSSLLCDIFKTLLLLCITCCTNINRRAFIRIFSSDPEIFESPCCHIENILLQCWAQHHIGGGRQNQAGWMVNKAKKLDDIAPMWFGCLVVRLFHPAITPTASCNS